MEKCFLSLKEVLKKKWQKREENIKEENKKISYYNYITSLKNKECNKALAEIFPKIDMEKINLIIDEIDCITETRKNFYKKVIHYRYTQILDKTYKRL